MEQEGIWRLFSLVSIGRCGRLDASDEGSNELADAPRLSAHDLPDAGS